jgi:general stress protein YciG
VLHTRRRDLPDDTEPPETASALRGDVAGAAAQIAGMGGKAIAPEKRSFSQDRRLAAAAGKKGGRAVSDADRTVPERARSCRQFEPARAALQTEKARPRGLTF